MTIAVQKGHESIKDSLRNLGYDVVTFGEYNGAISALIYSGSIDDDLSMPKGFDMAFSGNNSINSKGILMINLQNKSIVDIDTILKKKVYSPLF